MCFSAEASFIGAGVLVATGMATLKYRSVPPAYLPLAITPFIFAFQQFFEGMVWLGYSGWISESSQLVFAMLFSFFAFTYWPAHMPLAAFSMEAKRYLRVMLLPLIALGVLVSLHNFWSLLIDDLSITLACSNIACGTLLYTFAPALPELGPYLTIAYLVPVAGSFFLTSNPLLRWIVSPLFLLSFPMAQIVSSPTIFASVWCFIGATLSVILFFSLPKKQQQDNEFTQAAN